MLYKIVNIFFLIVKVRFKVINVTSNISTLKQKILQKYWKL